MNYGPIRTDNPIADFNRHDAAAEAEAEAEIAEASAQEKTKERTTTVTLEYLECVARKAEEQGLIPYELYSDLSDFFLDMKFKFAHPFR